jgi:WD40 repeat protein/uncharacterized caspase-like protein
MCPRAVAKKSLSSPTESKVAKLWILLVGVNQYQDSALPSLQYSALDCQGLGEALTEATESFPSKQVILHHDFVEQKPNIGAIRQSLAKIGTQVQADDTILFYFSGHGVVEPKTEQVVLCLADTRQEALLETGLGLKELLRWFGNCAASQQLVWLDACHSGGMTLRGTTKISLSNPTPQLVQVLRKKAAQSQGFYALLSCDQTQQSWEFPELGHGVFTYYLMRGLRGEAADSQGMIEADGLYQYVYHQTLRYIDKSNQQIRLINQQKRSRGERQLQSEYPLQTPKRIVEGFGKVILGKRSPNAVEINPRQALIVDGMGNNQTSLAFSKILRGMGRFSLNYFPQTGKNWSTVKEAIATCLGASPSQNTSIVEPNSTALIYLRGWLQQSKSGETYLVFKQGVYLSRSWLRKILRTARVDQQIIIFDCPGAESLEEWIEDLRLESDKGQCLIAAAADLATPQQFSQALLETLKNADSQTGLPVAAWITQLQIYLAGTAINPYVWLSASRGIIEVLPGTNPNRNDDSGIFDLGICPYMGLRAFREEQAEYFYGREALTHKLLRQISHNSTLALVGASGSGKSSVVQAGLIAQLHQGKQIPGSKEWWLGCFRPGAKPLEALARKLVDAHIEKEKAQQQLQIEGLLYQGVEGFVQWLRCRREPMVMLVVDQFEEIFTLAEATDRQLLLDLLLGAVKYAGDRFKLVLTIRADFVAACLEIPELATILQQSSILVPPYLKEEDYRSAIVKPAEQVGLKIESGLVEVLLKELDTSAGDLPLLQFVLQQLWERRQQGKLTLNAYQQLGGIKGALERQAQTAYEQLDAEAQDCARWIFLNLTQLGEGTEDTRRRVTKSDLIVAKYPASLVERTLQALTAAKIIVVNLENGINSGQSRSSDLPTDNDELLKEAMQQEATIEVVHEILIRHWSTLRWWLEENRTRLRSQRQIEQAASLWQEKGKQADFLLRGVRLAEAEEIYINYTDELTEVGEQFIAACLEARDAEKREAKQRLRRTQITAVALGILGLAASTFASLAYRQKLLAQIEKINALNASSEALLLSNQQLESLNTSAQGGRELKQIGFWGQKLIGTDNWQETKIKTVTTLQQAIAQTQELNRLEEHSQQVNRVAYSPDGKILATASDDQTIKLWQADGTLITTLKEHQDRVTNLTFSPNGKILASASADGTVRLWQIEDNNIQPLRRITRHQDWVTTVAFNRDGTILASASRDGTIKLGQLDGTEIATVNGHQGWVNSIIFSPISDSQSGEGSILASAGEDGVIKLWSIVGNKIQEINSFQQSDRVTQVIFSPDGDRLVAAGGDGTIQFWQVNNGNLLDSYSQGDQVNSLAFSPDGQLLASAGIDGKVNIWSQDGLLQQVLAGQGGEIFSLSFRPSPSTSDSQKGEILASASADKTVRIWQIGDRATSAQGGIYSISVSPTSPDIFATAGFDGKVQIWRKQKDNPPKLLHTLSGHQMSVYQVQFSPDGKLLASASWDKTIKVWEVEDGTLLQTIKGHQDGINTLAFSPKSEERNYLLASGSEDKTIKLWQVLAIGNQYQVSLANTLTGHKDSVKTLAFSADGNLLASGSYDNTIKLWDAEGKLLQTLEGHNLAIAALAFNSHGNLLASGSWDNTIKLWRIDKQKAVPLQTLAGHQDGVTTLKFSDDDTILASGSADGTIKLWHAQNNSLIKTLKGHISPINSLALSDRGQTIISADEQQGILFWNFDLDRLLTKSCDRLSDYLQTNPNLTQRDRLVCNY